MTNLPYNKGNRRPTGKYYVSESSALQSGTAFVEIKVESGLGYPASRGYFVNDGPGNASITITFISGTTSGAAFTIKPGESFNLRDEQIVSSLNYSYSGTSGNYRSYWN